MKGILSVKKLRQPRLGLPQFFYVCPRIYLSEVYIVALVDASPITPHTGEVVKNPPYIYI